MKYIIFVFSLFFLTACSTTNKYRDFDYSYARSGGLSPIYENLLIKNQKVHYSFESQNKNVKEDFKISTEELQSIKTALEVNNFRTIQEDYRKLYDYISTSINVKKGDNSASKSDASYIRESDKQRWDNVVAVFEKIIADHVKKE